MGDAQAISLETASCDAVVSALMLNFVPDKLKALMEMKRVARAGATVGFYVWDYPGQGVEFMHAFWDAAAALDSVALELAEDKRFSFCTPDGLGELMSRAALLRLIATRLRYPRSSLTLRTIGARSRWAQGLRQATAQVLIPKVGSA